MLFKNELSHKYSVLKDLWYLIKFTAILQYFRFVMDKIAACNVQYIYFFSIYFQFFNLKF